jgi:3',5'-cyclic AMP phosphodiesterase CpdA
MTGVSRRTFLKTTAVLLGIAPFSANGVEAGVSSTSGGGAVLRVKHSSRFRILQLTDLHFFSRDKSTWDDFNARTVDQMRKIVEFSKPDLVMISGDVWSDNKEEMGEAHMRYAIEKFESLGVPWAFAWGNHDKLNDFSPGHEAFALAKNSLYRGVDSDGNYVINIVDDKGRLVWRLLCVNTHREGFGAHEQKWVRALPKLDVPQFAFFHIPLKQYAEIWENGAASGIWGEPVCMENEDGTSLSVLKDAGVNACFCGHDHQNDYSGLADGVELVYGRVSRAGGYGADTFQKGGKLITVNCRKRRYEWDSITPDGRLWRPKKGQRDIMTC